MWGRGLIQVSSGTQGSCPRQIRFRGLGVLLPAVLGDEGLVQGGGAAASEGGRDSTSSERAGALHQLGALLWEQVLRRDSPAPEGTGRGPDGATSRPWECSEGLWGRARGRPWDHCGPKPLPVASWVLPTWVTSLGCLGKSELAGSLACCWGTGPRGLLPCP